MFCSKCGKTMDNNAKFCQQCGAMTPQPYGEAGVNQQTEEIENKPLYSTVFYSDTQAKQAKPVKIKKTRKKMSKGKKTVITLSVIVGILLALSVTLFCVLLTTPAFGVYRELRRENYSDALSDYRGDVEEEFIQEIILEVLLNRYDEKIVDKFKKNEIVYSSAVDALEFLHRIGLKRTEEKINEITDIENNNVAFTQASRYYEAGDYENAIKKYKQITKNSDKYIEAQTKLCEISPLYINKVVEKVEAYNSTENYEDAISYIDMAYGLISFNADTTKLEQIRNESVYAYTVCVRDETVRLVTEKQFLKAFELVESAIAVDDNKDFQNGKTMVESKYVEYIDEKVQKYLMNEDYYNATNVLKEALEVVPGNATLKKLQETVIDAEPTYLLKVCRPYTSSTYTEYVNGDMIKLGGNFYSNGFTLRYSGGYAVFNVNGIYKKLNFVVGHCDRTDSYDGTDGYDATIRIYYDGALKKEITMNTNDFPKEITLDITGVDQLRFELDASTAKYAFANITVK